MIDTLIKKHKTVFTFADLQLIFSNWDAVKSWGIKIFYDVEIIYSLRIYGWKVMELI